MRRFVLFGFLFFTCLISKNIFASTLFVLEGIRYNLNTSDQTAEVTFWPKSHYGGNIVIPPSVMYSNKRYTVTSIGERAFSGCASLTSIKIPESITSIGSSAFEYCSGLTSITIPNSITNISDYTFSGCSGLTEVNIPKSVTSIGNGAFRMCKSLDSINIPEGVTSIGGEAFFGCSGLTSIIMPESLTNIGKNVFYECSSLKSVNIKCRNVGAWLSDIISLEEVMIGEKVRRIENDAFYGCNNLSKVHINNLASWCEITFGTKYSNPLYFAKCLLLNNNNVDLVNLQIPNGAKVIGNYAFCNLKGLTSVSIPKSIEYIGEEAFIECPSLNSVMINSPVVGSWFNRNTSINKVILGDNVTSIEKSAFSGCSGLSSITIGDNVTKIDNNAFPFSTPIYVNRGTKSLLALWNAGYKNPIAINSNEVLKPPYMSVENVTQMTGTIKLHNIYADYTNMLNGEAVKRETITFRSRPEYTENVRLTATKDEVSFTTDIKYTTASLGCYVDQQSVTASSMRVTASHIQGDANVTSQKIAINGVSIEDSILHLNGLRPNSSYLVSYTIKVEDLYDYTKNVYLKTEPLEFTNALPRVISKGNVVISSTSNLDADETEVGFEWRRTDWTDDFASKSAGAYLYQSTMEGYIRDLNTDFLWKFRPYYCSSDGMKFYGNWSGIDPTDFSFFEPTIHTYDKTNVDGNSAKVRGYVMRGTDDITNQGFKYWTDVNRTRSAPPSNAQTVEASGTIMEAKISGLAYASTYHYVAFVRTSKGETFYGEERTFTTSNSPAGLESVEYNKKETEPAIYDINGRKLSKPQRGVNIMLMRDGSKRKLVVK